MNTPITDLQFWHLLALVLMIGLLWNFGNCKCECTCGDKDDS
jgi:hypothetical protein